MLTRDPAWRAMATADEVRRQLEYYFSEVNLRKDEFLLTKLREGDGFVPTKVLADFARMQRICGGDEEIILLAAEASSHVVVKRDCNLVGPVGPLPTLTRDGQTPGQTPRRLEGDEASTAFVGNLDPNVTEDILGELFAQVIYNLDTPHSPQVGPISQVLVPTDRVSGQRKGFGFVHFHDGPAAPGPVSVDYAAMVLDGLLLFGRPIRVSRRHSDSRSSRGR